MARFVSTVPVLFYAIHIGIPRTECLCGYCESRHGQERIEHMDPEQHPAHGPDLASHAPAQGRRGARKSPAGKKGSGPQRQRRSLPGLNSRGRVRNCNMRARAAHAHCAGALGFGPTQAARRRPGNANNESPGPSGPRTPPAVDGNGLITHFRSAFLASLP